MFSLKNKYICGVFFVLFFVLLFSSLAESVSDDFVADVFCLMPSDEKIDNFVIETDFDDSDMIVSESHSCVINMISSKDDVLNIVFDFDVCDDLYMGDAQWSTVSSWLRVLVGKSIQNISADAESIGHVVLSFYSNARESAVAEETGFPVWSDNRLVLRKITVTVPYLLDLNIGSSGDAVLKLQTRLSELGFMVSDITGIYDDGTVFGVQNLEQYVRYLEQKEIDKIEQPVQQIIDDGDNMPMVIDARLLNYEPETSVDGVADGLLQKYLYSRSFVSVDDVINLGDTGIQVERIQRRLYNLGYLLDDRFDGLYGSVTARALYLFQYFNFDTVVKPGVADIRTQNRLFSDKAVAMHGSFLSVDSEDAESVEKLQNRLYLLGFITDKPDGVFGSKTKLGVERVQLYMKSLESFIENGVPVCVNGIADPVFLDVLYGPDFPVYFDDLGIDSEGLNVERLQYRLSGLGYYYGSVDGKFGSGTRLSVESFQERNGLVVTGIVDFETQRVLFGDVARYCYKPYQIRVSVGDQRVYVYALDDNDEYSECVKTMKCSTGKKATPTPLGVFEESTGPGEKWHYFKKFDCWAQYAYYIEGSILFHSVIYNTRGGKATSGSVNALGHRASHGCVRLSVENAKWIYENCPAHTRVIIEN